MQTHSWQPETAPLTGTNRQETPFAPHMAGLIHDTRNMVSAMDIYCDLLAEQDVLSAPFRHYAGELQMIATSCRNLLDKMAGVGDNPDAAPSPVRLSHSRRPTPPRLDRLKRPGRLRVFLDSHPIESLADELQANQNLLAALSGPGITICLSIEGGHRPVSMAREDFTRIMVNLVKNAAEAMPGGGHIRISLREDYGSLLLTVEDSGPGIPQDALEQIFLSGYSSHANANTSSQSGSDPALGFGPISRRGLGLSIVRSLVAGAGGSVKAFNRKSTPAAAPHREPNQRNRTETLTVNPNLAIDSASGGAILQIELPCREAPNLHS